MNGYIHVKGTRFSCVLVNFLHLSFYQPHTLLLMLNFIFQNNVNYHHLIVIIIMAIIDKGSAFIINSYSDELNLNKPK